MRLQRGTRCRNKQTCESIVTAVVTWSVLSYMFVCKISIYEESLIAYNYYKRSNKAAPIPPYIPWDGSVLTNECAKYCNWDSGSLKRTVTVHCVQIFA